MASVRIFGVVKQLLGGALGQRRERPELVDQLVGRGFQVLVGDAFGDDAPFQGLAGLDALRAHHDVLGPGDADHLLQPRRTARSRDLAELLLGQRVLRGFRGDAEVAGERQFEADAEAIAAIGDDHRLGATSGRSNVPGKLGDRLGRCLHEAADIAAAGKILSDRTHHDDAYAVVLIECLEHQPELVALRHRHHVERRAVEDDVGAFMRFVDLDLEAVELGEAVIGEFICGHGFFFLLDEG